MIHESSIKSTNASDEVGLAKHLDVVLSFIIDRDSLFFTCHLKHITPQSMTKPNLLLCFDAFGTLFRPKRPIIEQYGEVARQFGLALPNDALLQSSFKNAFKIQSKQHPNYGKATGLGASKWWTAVG